MNNYILLIAFDSFYFRTKFFVHLFVNKVNGAETILYTPTCITDYIGKRLYVNSEDNICR